MLMLETVLRLAVCFVTFHVTFAAPRDKAPSYGFDRMVQIRLEKAISRAQRQAELDMKRAQKQAKHEVKTVVREHIFHARTGGDRLRGTLIDASGAAIGTILVFFGARVPRPAVLLLQSALVVDRCSYRFLGFKAESSSDDLCSSIFFTSNLCIKKRSAASLALAAALFHLPAAAKVVSWLIIGSMNARACGGIIDATAMNEERKAALRGHVVPLAAAAGNLVLAKANATSVPVSTISSALLGGMLLVECCREQLQNEFDEILIAATVVLKTIFDILRVDTSVQALFQLLLPLPKLVDNELNVVKTMKQSATENFMSAYNRFSSFMKQVVVTSVLLATQVPFLSASAKQFFSRVLDGQLEAKLQGVLPVALREATVASLIREAALRFLLFRLAVSGWNSVKKLLQKSGRWLLPHFFATWGCAVQAGRLRLLQDAPKVIAYLLPAKWGKVIPHPTKWLMKCTKQIYSKYIIQPMKRFVKESVLRLVSLLKRMSSRNATPRNAGERRGKRVRASMPEELKLHAEVHSRMFTLQKLFHTRARSRVPNS